MFKIFIGLDNDEFISAVPGKKAVGIQNSGQTISKCLNEFVSFFVPVGIVDMLQVIQIKHHHTDFESTWKFSEFRNLILEWCFIMDSGDIPESINQ